MLLFLIPSLVEGVGSGYSGYSGSRVSGFPPSTTTAIATTMEETRSTYCSVRNGIDLNDSECACLSRAGSSAHCEGGVPDTCHVPAPADGFTSFFAWAECDKCRCKLSPIIHKVTAPSEGTVITLGSTFTVRWHANAGVTAVTILLYQSEANVGPADPAGQSWLGEIPDLENTGSYEWSPEAGVLKPGKGYTLVLTVAASDDGTDTGFSARGAKTSATFEIATQPAGKCPAGHFSATGAWPDCTPCVKGTYPDTRGTACWQCPHGFTTAGAASQTYLACSLTADDPLSQYVMKPNRRINPSSSAYATIAEERAEGCAFRCTNDLACKSFGHLGGGGGGGSDDPSGKECVLTYDNYETRFEPLITVADARDVVYEKLADDAAFCTDTAQTTYASSSQPGTPATCPELLQIGGCGHSDHGTEIRRQCPKSCGRCVPLSLPANVVDVAFLKRAGQFLEFDFARASIAGATPARRIRAGEFTSVETCAQLCLRDPNCKSFEAGSGGRAGECYTSQHNIAETKSVQLVASPFGEVDHYELGESYRLCDEGTVCSWGPCGKGMVSMTGWNSNGCKACPTDTYSDVAVSTVCTACPAGKHSESAGTTSRDGCVDASCPPGSTGPNADGDCTCSSDSNCIDGSSSINDRGNCRISATGVGSVFNVGCAGCHCVAADPTAEVKAVTAPRSDAAWSIGSTQTISYTYTPGVQYVYIALYKEVRYKSGNLGAVMIISALSIATGNYVWVVPDLEPTHGYYIIIYQRIGYQLIGAHTSSGRFEIIVEGAEPCPRGEINADTGRRPCTLCDTGTFWTSARQCTSCPADTTTMTHGAQSVEDCYVNATNPIYSFEHVPHHYIKGSNAAGVFLEEHEEMSVEACAQLCLDDAGCKSFDAGVVGPYMSQEGDCFLSYDNRATAETGAFRPINQLNYYEKKHTQSVLTEFSKTDDCYIIGHDNGGSFDSVHTPEACGQLCLNDPCCTSFEVGVYNTITALDCRLSYVTVDLVNAKKVVCGKEHMMHLYKKTPSVTFHFKGVLYSETIKTDRDKESFEAFVKAAFETAGVSGTVESAAITTSPIDTIDCTVTFETLQGKQEAQSVLGGDGGLVFWWPIAIEGFGVKYVGSFRGADGGAESGRQRFRRQIGGLSGASMMKCTLECAANHDVLDPMASADCMAACTKKVDDNEDNDDADASPTIDTATTTATATTLAMTTGQDYQAGDDGDDGIWFDDDVVTPPPCNAGQRDDPTCGGSSGMYQRNECHIDYVVNLCPVMCRACTYIPSFDDRIRQGPCDPGTVSQTGSHPLCHTCRANTFSSPASTQCKPCPGGTTSIPGASSVSECIQTVIGDSPALFSVGDNWVGTYSLDHGSLDLSAWQILPSLSGALHLSVTAIIGNRLQFLLGVYHGEACNPPCSTARDEQLSEFYVTGVPSGAVMNLAVDLTGPHGGWAGITDRNFARAGLFGVVEKDVTTGGSYSFSGIFGDGAFKVSRACSTHRQGEADVLVPGDTFVGWSHCNRNQNQDGTDAVDGEKDVRRLQMKVSNYYASAGTVTGTVLFEDEQGRPFEYGVAGDFSPLSGCRSLSLSPTNQSAWKTRPPFGTRSRQLSGRLSDDGITFTGEWNANAECACLGASPTGAEGSGAACGYHGKSDMWCFVGPNCPEGVNKMNGPSGWYTAPCAPMPACPRFTMTRVCSATKSCPHGWEMFANNCYKAFDDVSEYQDAQATCESFNATLSSIASVEEATFLLQKAAQRRFSASHGAGAGAGAGAGDAQASQPMFNATSLTLPTIWIGLMTNATQAAAVISAGGTHENTWADGTLVGSDLDTVTVVSSSGSRRNPVNCGVLGVREGSVASGLIVTLGRCQAEVRFVCKREHLAVDTSSDAENNDGTSGLSPTTTSTPDLNTPNCHDADNGTYYDKNTGTCATCTSVTDCDEAETLVGTCSNTQTPRCVACYETCKSCSAPGSTACTMCVKSWYMSLEQPGLCVQECEFGQVKADKPRRCTACHPTCETCTGSSEDECESCLGSLYLLPSIFNTSEVSANDSDDKGYKGVLSVGTCFGECPEGMFKSRGTQTCVACSKCHFNQYQRRLCSGFQDTLCRDTTRCKFAPPKGDGTPASYSEYESKAPTFISDRECTDVTKCMKGEEQVTAPTHVSDSICQACKPGHVDDDRNGKTPCTKCLPGTFTSAAYGFIGKNACKKCPSGTVDDDSDPTTPCTSCSLASGQFVEEKGGTECSNVTSCDIGYEPINAARVDENVRCARCTDGFHKPVAGNTACTATPWCEPGYQPTRNATNIDDWGCRKCAAGTFKPTMGSERCKPFTVCNEGFQDFDASHDFVGSDRDQYCSPCLNSVTFSVLNGIRRSCMPVKECGLDEYENVPPTLSTDRECTARTLCNTNQYLSAAGSKTADSECAALATCRRNQWIVYQPDVLLVGDGRVANRICADCTVCNNTEQALSVCTKSTDTICSGCGKTCSPAYIANKGGTSIVNWGQFETSACGTDSGDGDIARKCQACTPCNYPKEYVRTLCTGADDTVCADSTACNFSDEFELSPPQGTEDRVCVPVTICGDGEGESVPPTETSDRECTLCVAGSSFIDVTSSPSTVKCKAVSSCAAGFEESAAPTAVSDRQCTPCADGTFKGGSGRVQDYGTTLSKPECASCDGTTASGALCTSARHNGVSPLLFSSLTASGHASNRAVTTASGALCLSARSSGVLPSSSFSSSHLASLRASNHDKKTAASNAAPCFRYAMHCV